MNHYSEINQFGYDKININKKFNSLIKKCNLNIQDKQKNTPLIYALRSNCYVLDLNKEQWDYLIKNSDLNQVNQYGYNALTTAIRYNVTNKLNLNKEQLDYLIKNTNLNIQDNHGRNRNALMWMITQNQTQNLNINEEQWDYLIKNSDLTKKDIIGNNILMYYLSYKENINLTKEQINYLIQHSDLTQKNDNGWTALMFSLYNNKKYNLNLTKNQFYKMYDDLDKEEQQNTFQKFIQENNRNKKKYIEEMNILLYDCEFKPNEKTIHWLKENNYQDILEMIEKRDLLFQLNQEVKLNNHQKISKIKI